MYSLLLFTFEITVAEVLFSFGLKKRGLFALRLLAWFAVMAGAAALCMLLPDVVFANALVMSMLFIGLFILSVLLMAIAIVAALTLFFKVNQVSVSGNERYSA